MDDDFEKLKLKRLELTSRRRSLKGELSVLAADIAAIDRVLTMFDPAYKPKRKRAPARPSQASNPFASGEMVPAALNALRTLKRPATSHECAQEMLVTRGYPTDEAVVSVVSNRVSALLGQKAETGQVKRAGHADGRKVLWQIAA